MLGCVKDCFILQTGADTEKIQLSRRYHYRCLAGCNEDLRQAAAGLRARDLYAASDTRDNDTLLHAMYGHGRGEPWTRSAEIVPVVLHSMKVLTSRSSGEWTLTPYLASWYIRHFDPQTGRSTMPTVVFTYRAPHAGLLLSFLRKIATKRFGDEAASRIKGIWAGVQDDAWIRRFLSHPKRFSSHSLNLSHSHHSIGVLAAALTQDGSLLPVTAAKVQKCARL
ncbi:hypothetical protein V1527DRAFT_271475 [Lipomyces starkeyi]